MLHRFGFNLPKQIKMYENIRQTNLAQVRKAMSVQTSIVLCQRSTYMYIRNKKEKRVKLKKLNKVPSAVSAASELCDDGSDSEPI